MNRSLSLGLFLLLLPGQGTAQTITGTRGVYHVSTQNNPNGPVSGDPCVEEGFTLTENYTFPQGNCPVGETTTASWHRCVGPGVLSGKASIDGLQYQPPGPCGTGAGGNAWVNQKMIASDVVFRDATNPSATGNVSVTWNLEFSGHSIPAPNSCIGASATVSASAGTPTGNAFLGSGVSGTWSGQLAGYAGDDSVLAVTSNPFSVPLGQPQQLRIELNVAASSTICESQAPTSTQAQTRGLLVCARSGPVFNLPPNITVDSAQLGIADNLWVVVDTDEDGLPDGCETCPNTVVYCAATPSGGCTPSIGSSGTPSSAPNGFLVTGSSMVNNKPCLLLYGVDGPAALPFQGGTLCLAKPFRRTPLGNTLGNPPPQDCSGAPSIDMNCFAAGLCGGTPLPGLHASGSVVNCQWWGRGTGGQNQLSNGLQYTVCP